MAYQYEYEHWPPRPTHALEIESDSSPGEIPSRANLPEGDSGVSGLLDLLGAFLGVDPGVELDPAPAPGVRLRFLSNLASASLSLSPPALHFLSISFTSSSSSSSSSPSLCVPGCWILSNIFPMAFSGLLTAS